MGYGVADLQVLLCTYSRQVYWRYYVKFDFNNNHCIQTTILSINTLSHSIFKRYFIAVIIILFSIKNMMVAILKSFLYSITSTLYKHYFNIIIISYNLKISVIKLHFVPMSMPIEFFSFDYCPNLIPLKPPSMKKIE